MYIKTSISIVTMTTYFYVSGVKWPVKGDTIVFAKLDSTSKVRHVGLSSISRLQNIEHFQIEINLKTKLYIIEL